MYCPYGYDVHELGKDGVLDGQAYKQPGRRCFTFRFSVMLPSRLRPPTPLFTELFLCSALAGAGTYLSVSQDEQAANVGCNDESAPSWGIPCPSQVSVLFGGTKTPATRLALVGE